MIGALHVQYVIESSLVLVDVIGDVHHQIRWPSVGADEDRIFGTAMFFGLEPNGAVFLVTAVALSQHLQCRVHFPCSMEICFVEPVVKRDSQFVEVIRDPSLHAIDGRLAKEVFGLVVKLGERTSQGLLQMLGNGDEILALISVLGNFVAVFVLLLIPHPQRFGEQVNLPTFVIAVVFSLDFVPNALIQGSQHIAQYGLSPVPHG